MPRINKPTFPQLTTADLEKKIDKLGDAIEQATAADGSVDVSKVEDAVSADPTLRSAFEEVKDSFQRREMRTVSDGCGGGTTRREVDVDPAKLDAGEVRSVMSALLEAKTRVSTEIDKDGDGKLTADETDYPDGGAGLAGEIAGDVASGAVAGWKSEMREWRETITDALESVETRQRTDSRIEEIAGEHAATDLGKEAIVWSYREVLASGRGVDTWHLEDQLDGAERSFLRHLPLFGRAVRGEGHLNDDEVMRFLGTNDLRELIAEKKQAIEQAVGGDYLTHWLEGRDVAGIDQKDDPDFHRVSTGC
jgi:hypothetical protein